MKTFNRGSLGAQVQVLSSGVALTTHQVEVDKNGRQVGKVAKLQDNIAGDDFAFGPDGSIYLTTNFDDTVLKLQLGGSGTPSLVANIPGACSCAFGRTETETSVLYVTTRFGEIFSVQL